MILFVFNMNTAVWIKIIDGNVAVCASDMQIGISFFFFKQKTAYEMRISDWSTDVCSSDLFVQQRGVFGVEHAAFGVGELAGAGLHRQGLHADQDVQIGRASCRERACQYV